LIKTILQANFQSAFLSSVVSARTMRF